MINLNDQKYRFRFVYQNKESDKISIRYYDIDEIPFDSMNDPEGIGDILISMDHFVRFDIDKYPVYENDIVEVVKKGGDDNRKHRGAVIWHKRSYGYRIEGIKTYKNQTASLSNKVRYLGNLWQNGDLI